MLFKPKPSVLRFRLLLCVGQAVSTHPSLSVDRDYRQILDVSVVMADFFRRDILQTLGYALCHETKLEHTVIAL